MGPASRDAIPRGAEPLVRPAESESTIPRTYPGPGEGRTCMRSMLALASIIPLAAALGAAGCSRDPAVRAVNRMGGRGFTAEDLRDYGLPSWMEDAPPNTVVEVDLRHCQPPARDGDLLVLDQFPEIRRLFLDNAAVTDAGMAPVARCGKLRALYL